MKLPSPSGFVAGLALAVLGVTTFAPKATAVGSVIVNFGGNYMSDNANKAGRRSSTAITDGVLFSYNDGTPASPLPTNYEGTSGTYYAVAQMTTAGGGVSGSYALSVLYAGGQNSIIARSKVRGTSETGSANVQGMIFWKKEDFLAGASTETLKLSDIGELYVNASNVRSTQAALRFAVQSDGVWYLSEKALTSKTFLADAALGALTMEDPATLMWAAWNPQSSPTSLLNPAPTVYDVDGGTLNSITAVGYYFLSDYALPNAAHFDVNAFRVTTIPEPSSAALMGGAALLLLGVAVRFPK